MLLRYEVYAERALPDQQHRAEKVRIFSHLKVHPRIESDGRLNYSGSRDLLVRFLLQYAPVFTILNFGQKALPLNTPTIFELDDEEQVTITLLDANHCPGAVMYVSTSLKNSHVTIKHEQVPHPRR